MFSGGSNLCCGGNENLCKFAKTFRNLSRRETQLYHIKEKMAKAMKGLGVLKRLSRMPPQRSLLTIYKLFIQPHLDYVDVLYDQPIQYCSGHYLYHHQPAAKPTYNIHNHIGLNFSPG